jgi:hypothetical protein
LDLFEASLAVKLHKAIVSDLGRIHLQWRSVCSSDGLVFYASDGINFQGL